MIVMLLFILQRHIRCLSCIPPAMSDILAEMMDIKVLKNKSMAVMCLANIFAMFAYTVPFVFIAPRAVGFGVPATQAAFLVSIMGKCVSNLAEIMLRV